MNRFTPACRATSSSVTVPSVLVLAYPIGSLRDGRTPAFAARWMTACTSPSENTCSTSSGSQMSPSTSRNRSSASSAATLSRFRFGSYRGSKLSRPMTLSPRVASAWLTCDPMNPAAPVTSTAPALLLIGRPASRLCRGPVLRTGPVLPRARRGILQGIGRTHLALFALPRNWVHSMGRGRCRRRSVQWSCSL